jgi:quercetin dioxygenase-like cupin family protein
MIIKQAKDVPGASVGPAAPGVTKQLLIGPADGAPEFAMRCFTILPGGNTPLHKHDWEHEVFVVEGEGIAVGEKGETPLKPGNIVFVPGGEMHQFKNAGRKPFAMLCLVPMRGEK